MECNLILPKKTVNIGELVLAKVEIKNISKQDLNIIYNTDPLEYLDLEVIDPTGKKISTDGYGGRFSPFTFSPEQKLTLRAGETYRGKVSIYGNSKESDRTKAGVYKIIAIYEYKKEKAISKQVELTVMPK